MHSRWRRKWSKVIVLLSLVALIGGCASPAPADQSASKVPFNLVEPGVLTVAFSDGNMPEIAMDGDKLVGTDGDWITKLAEKYGLKLKLVPMAFSAQVLAVSQGKADIGTTAYWLEERAKVVRYTYPFWQDTTAIFTRKANPEFSDAASLEGRTVGTLAGWAFVEPLKKNHPADKVLEFQTLPQLYAALVQGNVDAIVAVIGGQDQYYEQYKDVLKRQPLNKGEFGLPDKLLQNQAYNYVRCDNKGLTQAMDDLMVEMRGSGEWKQILEKYKIDPSPMNIPDLKVPGQLCG